MSYTANLQSGKPVEMIDGIFCHIKYPAIDCRKYKTIFPETVSSCIQYKKPFLTCNHPYQLPAVFIKGRDINRGKTCFNRHFLKTPVNGLVVVGSQPPLFIQRWLLWSTINRLMLLSGNEFVSEASCQKCIIFLPSKRTVVIGNPVITLPVFYDGIYTVLASRNSLVILVKTYSFCWARQHTAEKRRTVKKSAHGRRVLNTQIYKTVLPRVKARRKPHKYVIVFIPLPVACTRITELISNGLPYEERF